MDNPDQEKIGKNLSKTALLTTFCEPWTSCCRCVQEVIQCHAASNLETMRSAGVSNSRIKGARVQSNCDLSVLLAHTEKLHEITLYAEMWHPFLLATQLCVSSY